MAGVKISTRLFVYKRDDYECRYCGRAVVRFTLNRDCEATVDHVVARSAGGSNRADNLVTACWPCNQSKADASALMFCAEAA